MKEGKHSFYNPSGFCNAFRIKDSPIDVMKLRDFEEFLLAFFNELEIYFSKTKYQSLINDTFSGSYCNKFTCLNCSHLMYCAENWIICSEKIEPFLTVHLKVNHYANIEDSLNNLLEAEKLECFCEKCEKKVRKNVWEAFVRLRWKGSQHLIISQTFWS